MASTAFKVQNIFSAASRERCLKNFKNIRVPTISKSNIDLKSLPTAAVLVPLCSIDSYSSLLYTVRSSNLKSHSGQISFPGGKTDKGETPIETALRETEEEIGLHRENVEVWGYGPSFPGRNNQIMITPVIGSIMDLKEEHLNININEVSVVFAVSLETLCNPKNQFYTQFQNGYILPVFMANGYKIWGLTAIITHVFLTTLLPKDVYSNDWSSKKIKLDKKILPMTN
ncbi:nucleoside diphosphate-linked moiety X motif 8-like [Aricia agestis]|uniref:nucleoside diphosphate-linked moiety X motif 8-like n=1 Tax=Aricia agestis TaxID=91739 RepID=UPI001C2016F5|nr:nucleoside diphosphate-linked moiety X motif 8-like [Aricia agestis]